MGSVQNFPTQRRNDRYWLVWKCYRDVRTRFLIRFGVRSLPCCELFVRTGATTQIWKILKAEVEVVVTCEDAGVEEVVEEIGMILDLILVRILFRLHRTFIKYVEFINLKKNYRSLYQWSNVKILFLRTSRVLDFARWISWKCESRVWNSCFFFCFFQL